MGWTNNPESGDTMAKLNIYEMYVKNGNKALFWVKRDSWANGAMLITSVAGMASGPLEGKAPYYGNPKVKGKYGGTGPEREVSCPGTFGYSLIGSNVENRGNR